MICRCICFLYAHLFREVKGEKNRKRRKKGKRKKKKINKRIKWMEGSVYG